LGKKGIRVSRYLPTQVVVVVVIVIVVVVVVASVGLVSLRTMDVYLLCHNHPDRGPDGFPLMVNKL
jgi:hypothetical protein